MQYPLHKVCQAFKESCDPVKEKRHVYVHISTQSPGFGCNSLIPISGLCSLDHIVTLDLANPPQPSFPIGFLGYHPVLFLPIYLCTLVLASFFVHFNVNGLVLSVSRFFFTSIFYCFWLNICSFAWPLFFPLLGVVCPICVISCYNLIFYSDTAVQPKATVDGRVC